MSKGLSAVFARKMLVNAAFVTQMPIQQIFIGVFSAAVFGAQHRGVVVFLRSRSAVRYLVGRFAVVGKIEITWWWERKKNENKLVKDLKKIGVYIPETMILLKIVPNLVYYNIRLQEYYVD